ncbi:hypothetical protein PRUPE_7G220700 [Prunus persica]|uniref:Uncharacterized protein n=1 Tax=Prunus persica TaxID=3760 RepID=M5WGV9_PRUPE|nr:hypothetical protein PRUPE_7G220700 [Prunus persica]
MPAGNFIIKHESNAVKGSLAQKKKKKKTVMDGKDQSLKKRMLISGLLGLTMFLFISFLSQKFCGWVPQPLKFVLRPTTCLYFS